MSLNFFPTCITPHEYAAHWLANEQHAKGNTVRLRNFKVEYVRPDGSVVPDYDHYLKRVLNGECMHIEQ